MSHKIIGRVASIYMMPGQSSIGVTLSEGVPSDNLFESSVVTWDGEPVSVEALVVYLLDSPGVWVTLHPQSERYGMSLRTEFSSTEVKVSP
jgi:hypothetical protein